MPQLPCLNKGIPQTVVLAKTVKDLGQIEIVPSQTLLCYVKHRNYTFRVLTRFLHDERDGSLHRTLWTVDGLTDSGHLYESRPRRFESYAFMVTKSW